jgi:TolA-binding protein
MSFAITTVALGAPKQEEHYTLSAEEYSKLALYERSQYDKAVKLYNKGQYRSAAVEFEKYKLNYPDSEILSTIVFMRARCLHKGKDRYTAIQVYNEVLDFFGWKVDLASVAIYYKAMAYIESGDVRKGMMVFEEMAQDEDYSQHQLAAEAIRKLGDYYYKNEKYNKAVKYWKQVAEDFSKKNPSESALAREKVIDHQLAEGDLNKLKKWLISEDVESDANARVRVADLLYSRAAKVLKQEKQKYQKDFFEFYVEQKPFYLKQEKKWQFLSQTLNFAIGVLRDDQKVDKYLEEVASFAESISSAKARFEKHKWILSKLIRLEKDDLVSKYITRIVKYINTIKDPVRRDDQFVWFVEFVTKLGQYDAAMHFLSKIENPSLKLYTEYRYYMMREQYLRAVEPLKVLRKGEDEKWSAKALADLATLYHKHLRHFKKAIECYREISNPPETLWRISECYYYDGQFEKAIMTLTEIKNIFPKQEAAAIWQMAKYYKAQEYRDQAVAHARLILEKYEASREASLAHQMLEKYDVLTGGGVGANAIK